MRLRAQLHTYDGRCGGRVLFSPFASLSVLSRLLASLHPRRAPKHARAARDIKPASMAILRRFFATRRGCPTGARLRRTVLPLDFTARLGRYLRHGALPGERERKGESGVGERYAAGRFCGMPREIRAKGDYGNLLRFLRPSSSLSSPRELTRITRARYDTAEITIGDA